MSLKCQRRGCGKDFDPANNQADSCRHHPGFPVFHEGLKGWSCCPKKFVDFADFFDHPGCAYSEHTAEKQAPPAAAAAAKDDGPGFAPIKAATAIVRAAEPLSDITPKVTSSLTTALAKQAEAERAAEAGLVVTVGMKCTRNACGVEYRGPESDEENCRYHEGAPVFHEGMKYWSCCDRKKTHDFDEFLSMPGCSTTTGHRWFKPKADTVQTQKCRSDWYQTPTHVIVSFFGKCIEPSKAAFRVNSDSLELELFYESNKKFSTDIYLGGAIVPGETTVEIGSTKVDIKLVKAVVGEQWAHLDRADAPASAS